MINTYEYEHWEYSLYQNQIVVEVKKDGKFIDNKFVENYQTFKELKFLMFRNKESIATIALIEYIGSNSNGFTFGLSCKDFELKTGFKKTAYHSAVARLKELGLLEKTNRFKQDKYGIIAPVYIFRADLYRESGH